jgi:RNAse (barnase) inhibitor barstar
MKRAYVIDGSRFSTLEGFYAAVGSVLIPDVDWGHNLDAFNDILSWPCYDEAGPYVLVWKNPALSRERLGHAEAVRQLERRLRRCHPSNAPHVEEQLELARQQKGPTVFDWLVEIIRDNDQYVELRLE